MYRALVLISTTWVFGGLFCYSGICDLWVCWQLMIFCVGVGHFGVFPDDETPLTPAILRDSMLQYWNGEN